MDTSILTDATHWTGLAAAAGVIGNRADTAVLAPKNWFSQRGHEPDASWVEPTHCVASYSDLLPCLSERNLTDLRLLLAGARAAHPEVTVSRFEQKATVGDHGKIIQIGTI